MTRTCPQCGSENLPEAKFCESCGFSLDAADFQPGSEPTRELSPRPGSLRDAIPFLTGGVEQAKARFDGWKQQKTRSETERLREAHFQEQQELQEQQQEPQKETFGRTVTRIVIGLFALALLIYILLRNPNLPPWMAQKMVNDLLGQ